jgi:acetyl-CoA carboxylase / biotin carboxylase 1
VGIGAYLVRLGQRVIQKDSNAPILLTGFKALNKLIGSDVYTSNLQLGGPNIMYTNGVSHKVVSNDLEGVAAILEWLSFVPKVFGADLPETPSADIIDRDVLVQPDKTLDARCLITGVTKSIQGDGSAPPVEEWVSGLFDRNSFVEYLGGWAKTVIVGRARLGGIPIGVITSETQPVTCRSPADPASPDSRETTIIQAGGVWYPDSAYKTAQAIRDFNSEGLPLMILANWRGFSGGQRDMFDQVLKFGSYIVEGKCLIRVRVSCVHGDVDLDVCSRCQLW